MTNKELQEELKHYPDDMMVMFEDNEYGETEITGIVISITTIYVSEVYAKQEPKKVQYISLK